MAGCLFGVNRAEAATYYVSVADGNDTNCTGLAQTAYTSGVSQPCPWATVAKINGLTFSAGDSILFKKGEVWREKLIAPSSGISGSPITFGAYGTGANPIFDGSDLVTG
ncbi:MAG: hypothetical protein NTZ38_03195, partial [Candidatus Taylorbacteria bacterium]|nr:hypothetical protein [Candidatus Taylorbacteria bacterium]